MPDLTVDRMRLSLEGISPSDAQRLATLVTQGLLRAEIAAEGEIEGLQVRVTPMPGTTMESLSRQIVAELIGQLNRTS
jgi:hypothetical protein